jgi:hypothetical protein
MYKQTNKWMNRQIVKTKKEIQTDSRKERKHPLKLTKTAQFLLKLTTLVGTLIAMMTV